VLSPRNGQGIQARLPEGHDEAKALVKVCRAFKGK
jgi:hypothetical protein